MTIFKQKEPTKNLSKKNSNKEEALSHKDSASSNVLFSSNNKRKVLFSSNDLKKKKNKRVKYKETKPKKINKKGFGKHKVKKSYLDDTTIKKPIKYGGNVYYLLRDDTYMKFLQVYPKDIMSRNNNEQILDMGVVMNMLKQYSKDSKLISLNMPIDTESQRTNLVKKLEKTENEVHRHFLEKKISKLEYLEQSSRMERSFLAMLFADTPQQLHQQVDVFVKSMSSGFPVKKLSFEEEKKILFKFNNQNEEIK